MKNACVLNVDEEEKAVAELQGALNTAPMSYRCNAVVVVGEEGPQEERVAKTVEWIMEREWNMGGDAPCVYTLGVGAKALLNAFSFLRQDARSIALVDWSPISSGRALPHRIMDDLYLGDYDCARNEALYDMGVHYIVNASGGFDNHFERHQTGVFKYHVVNVHDSPESQIDRYFESTLKFVEQARMENKKILIHCAAGISRSTTLTLVVLMTKHQMTLRDAFLHTKRIRTIVCPNSGFVQKLIDYEKRLRGVNSVSLPLVEGRYPSYFSLQDLILADLEAGGMLDAETKRLLSF